MTEATEQPLAATAIHPHLTEEHSALKRARVAARVAEENRGRDIVILDLRELTCVFDCFVLVSGSSRRQLHSIADEINRTFKQEFNDRRMGIEGYEISKWILLDYGDVVIHLFEPETRAYYALEELWSQAPKIVVESSLGKSVTDPVTETVAETVAAP